MQFKVLLQESDEGGYTAQCFDYQKSTLKVILKQADVSLEELLEHL